MAICLLALPDTHWISDYFSFTYGNQETMRNDAVSLAMMPWCEKPDGSLGAAWVLGSDL